MISPDELERLAAMYPDTKSPSLYIGNIPRSITAVELTRLFASIDAAVVVEYKDKDKYALAHFGSAAQAAAALEQHGGAELVPGGAKMKLDYKAVPREAPAPRTAAQLAAAAAARRPRAPKQQPRRRGDAQPQPRISGKAARRKGREVGARNAYLMRVLRFAHRPKVRVGAAAAGACALERLLLLVVLPPVLLMLPVLPVLLLLPLAASRCPR